MKAYLGVTGSVFGLIVVAHIWRIVEEGRNVLDVWWVLLTLLAAAMAVWAWRLFRQLPRRYRAANAEPRHER